jgi:hypothetical protein
MRGFLLMANYYSAASFIIPLTPDQAKFALSVIYCLEDDAEFDKSFDEQHEDFDFDKSVFELSKTIFNNHLEVDDPDYFSLEFCAEKDETGLWVSCEEYINSHNAAYLTHAILKFFNINKPVLIEVGSWCDRRQLEGFGGHAAFVTRDSVEWVSTSQWLHDKEVAWTEARKTDNEDGKVADR